MKNKPLEPHEITEDNYEDIINRYDPMIKKQVGQILKYHGKFNLEYEDLHQIALLAVLQVIRR